MSHQNRTIAITSFHLLISRNILASGLLNILLAEGYNIVLLVPEEKRNFFEREFSGPGVAVESVPRAIARIEIIFRYLALASLRTTTLAIKRKTEMNGSGQFIQWLIGNNPLWRVLFRTVDRLFTPRGRFTAVFLKYRPVLAFSTDIQNENDVRFIHEARGYGIPVVGMVRSWDNLTSKGLIRAVPDVLVVNNEIVEREALRYHGVSRGKIRVVGVPHYDRYQGSPPHARSEFGSITGLDPHKRWVVYAPTGDRYLGGNAVDCEVIAFLSDRLPQTHQLLIRMPPSDNVNLEGVALNPAVRIMRPGEQLSNEVSTFKNNELTAADDELLRDTLAHAEIVIAGPSTIVIDAAVYDRPIILVGFDGGKNRPYLASIRRYYDYDHFRPVITSGGAQLVSSFKELEDSLNEYIRNPAKDHEGRREIVSRECGKLDGQSSARLADVIASVSAPKP